MQPTRFEDILAVEAQGFRHADELECRLAGAMGCAENCFQALETRDAETFTIMNDGLPVGLFGQVPFNALGSEPGWCVLWLLCSDGLYEISKDFLRQAPLWLDYLQRYYPTGVNYVHVDNTAAVKWTQSVGFELGSPEVYGVANAFFHEAKRKMPGADLTHE